MQLPIRGRNAMYSNNHNSTEAIETCEEPSNRACEQDFVGNRLNRKHADLKTTPDCRGLFGQNTVIRIYMHTVCISPKVFLGTR